MTAAALAGLLGSQLAVNGSQKEPVLSTVEVDSCAICCKSCSMNYTSMYACKVGFAISSVEKDATEVIDAGLSISLWEYI